MLISVFETDLSVVSVYVCAILDGCLILTFHLVLGQSEGSILGAPYGSWIMLF